jgi:hypothetical protein
VRPDRKAMAILYHQGAGWQLPVCQAVGGPPGATRGPLPAFGPAPRRSLFTVERSIKRSTRETGPRTAVRGLWKVELAGQSSLVRARPACPPVSHSR